MTMKDAMHEMASAMGMHQLHESIDEEEVKEPEDQRSIPEDSDSIPGVNGDYTVGTEKRDTSVRSGDSVTVEKDAANEDD